MPPIVVHRAEITLCLGHTLLRRLAIPSHCLCFAFCDSATMRELNSQIVLRRRVPLLGGQAEPFDSFGFVLRRALSAFEKHAKIVLGIH